VSNATTAAVKTPLIVGAAGWHIQTVDSSGDVGGFTSLRLTPAGWPAISYYDNTTKDLKYTYKDASGWHNQVVDSGSGGAPSLAPTSAGWPAISYFASFYEAFGNLKYTYKDASGWHKQTVDSGVDVGKYSSLRLTTAGWPAISYYDYTNYDLKYAYKSAS
jgi:hypothetical protein